MDACKLFLHRLIRLEQANLTTTITETRRLSLTRSNTIAYFNTINDRIFYRTNLRFPQMSEEGTMEKEAPSPVTSVAAHHLSSNMNNENVHTRNECHTSPSFYIIW
ncbi:hypothetical protein X798_05758 [Onchocerca flexuosa]|uniref:Uncharacterized protein n=1 Tax=Onchocerca flexuosa TaxID=387005 RepID=A0A238BPL8_9BILA|nr:hypothetical protein X798_05758 [Onchocerca flexuosa]